ncbi:hypothetical protein GCM10027280_50090 [Micromonospora polyrhachis]|uniref:Uncharacterized protein n=1 Tax=Micromonospora polyrhachis TaxID=1282883 RepID=A0A7W7STM1_9ACTN|nr:hypothetical protein [Micromonospora polyrhachis]MBB4960757.1 hypothetical protein [Micromonospora polyrhachis]
MTAPDLPCIPPGTLLRLDSEDWYHPDEANCDVDRTVALIVAKVHTDSTSATSVSVWITGHAPECTWPTSEYHPPCIQLRVRCEALRRIVEGQR